MVRVNSSDLEELFFTCQPDPQAGGDLASQIRSLYEGIFDSLNAEGALPEHVVMEKVFFRNVAAGRDALTELRIRQAGDPRWAAYNPASLLIEEPPDQDRQHCEAQLVVMIPAAGRAHRWWSFGPVKPSRNGGAPVLPPVGKALEIDGKRHYWIGNVLGRRGSGFHTETVSMFEEARDLLAAQGVAFTSVVRTWLYLNEMERDYGELNRGRRDFFRANGVERRPASTGIGGTPSTPGHDAVLCLYAITGVSESAVEIMHTPTLNEACEYGSDFSRGMRVDEGGRRTLYISGTASVDEQGATVALNDFEAQVERMLVNVDMLLENQGATWDDIVSAITYLKDIRTAERFRACLHARRLPDFPHSIVKAEVCRPELLCEIEAIGVMPLARGK
jgi:enamine deaminase RidA (YjgF/YER057c/UK114 family)